MPPLIELRDKATFVGDLEPYEGRMQDDIWWVANSRPAIWTARVALLGILAILVLSAWPEEVVRGDISYTGLQDELIASNVAIIEIDGNTATGTFHRARTERGGEIAALGRSTPGEPGETVRTVNGFAATISNNQIESFTGLAERTADEVRIVSHH